MHSSPFSSPGPSTAPAPPTRWGPNVTVAALIERDGRYLMVEERTADGQLKLNNPAGHLEFGESLLSGCRREVLEETAWHFEPQYLIGIYLLPRERKPGAADQTTFLRFCFGGKLGEHADGLILDAGIERTLWLSAQELRDSVARHRSPGVVHGLDDYLAGKRYPLALLNTHLHVLP